MTENRPPALPAPEKPGVAPLPSRLAPLAETARDYARAATSQNTNRAYAADWRHYCAWARRQNLPALPPDPQVLGLYIAACASGAAGPKPSSVGAIERRLSALAWNFAQRGETFDRKDRHVATVLAGIRRTHGLLLTLRGKTGWREVEIGRGSSDATCPVAALQTWLKFARISVGPVFRRVVGGKVGAERLTDRHVARLVKHAALAAGVRGDLTEGERERKFSGHSLRAGLASSAEVDERYVQKQLGHASAEMTRRYQRRRDRFRVNLTKAAGL